MGVPNGWSPWVMRRPAAIIATLALASAVAAGCGGDDSSGGGGDGGSPATTGESGGTFVLSNLADPDPIDPALTSHTMSRTLERNVYESLVYYKLGTTEIEPVLATEWTVSDDGLVYDFTLREGVKFQDGTPFDSADVKATLDRDMRLKTGVGGSYLSDVESVEAPSPTTVKITLNRPYAYFLGKLPKVGIASDEDIENHKGDDDAQTWFKDNANGTGPWKLDRYERGTQYTLVRNPNYWRDYPPGSFDTIVVRPVAESATQSQLIQRGEVNMGSWMSLRDMVEDDKAPGVKLSEEPSPMTLIGSLHGGRAPLDDVKVREALLAAFPYDQMRDFYQGHADEVTNVLSPAYDGAKEFPVLTQDIEKAKSLLAEAGYPNGDGMPQLRLAGTAGLEDMRQAGLLFQDALREIGVELKVDFLPGNTFIPQAQDPKTAADISLGYEAPETNDPFEWFNKLFGKEGFLNLSHFSVPELDKTIADAQVSTDEAARAEDVHKAQDLIMENVMVIPMANFDAVYAVSEFVGGFTHDITDLLAVPKFYGMVREGS